MDELSKLAGRKGFMLMFVNPGEIVEIPGAKDADDIRGAKFVLDDAEHENTDCAYFKTEVGLRFYLDGFPDVQRGRDS